MGGVGAVVVCMLICVVVFQLIRGESIKIPL